MAVKFLDWYVKIAVVSALVGGSMELFMIKTGFCVGTLHFVLVPFRLFLQFFASRFSISLLDDKVTVLEAEQRAWENSPEAQAIRESLNPWRHHDAEAKRNS